MSRIKQLSPHEAQKIAAGEVVERPANVVKELIENAIDAGATTITAYIEDAGKLLIRVVDNGWGMSEEDAHLCFAHHATSKITTVDDLEKLQTFGFRGEALSSIAAVSEIHLITKESIAAQGTKLILHAGTFKEKTHIACHDGTDITIHNLFFNVPARKKFLKARETELRQITQLFQAFCFDYLSIHFKLLSDGSSLFNCPPVSSLEQRIAQLWDHKTAEQMLMIKQEDHGKGVAVQGIISNHTYARYDRGHIFFFVNKRWVKNSSLNKALLKGYMNVLQQDRYPAGCIFLTINPSNVDINIHPRKEEVQFLNPKIVENIVHHAVKHRLQDHLSASLNRTVELAEHSDASLHPARKIQLYNYQPIDPHPELPPLRYVNNFSQILPQATAKIELPKNNESIQQSVFNDPIKSPTSGINQEENYSIIGQFKKTYILIEQDEGLFIVDQHAAHERILYELFSSRFDSVASIKLMFPQVITINSADMALLLEHLNFFKSHHIEIEPFGDDQIIIQSIPSYLKEVPLEPLIKEAIGWILESRHLDQEHFSKKITEKLHAQMACKAAVKAGDVLTDSQMHQLLEDLSRIENRFTCPHGRPTGWAVPLYEIEKKFKRKQ